VKPAVRLKNELDAGESLAVANPIFATRRPSRFVFGNCRVPREAFRAETHQRASLSHPACGGACTPRFLPRPLTDLATIRCDKARAMRTIVVIFIFALITIVGEIYSDAVLRSGEVSSRSAPDPVAVAIAHGLKRG
jgi:hypothetical protein